METNFNIIEKMNVGENDVVFVYFDRDSRLDKVQEMYSGLVKAFPNNKVFALTDDVSVRSADKDSAIEMLEAMAAMLKE